MFIVKHTTVKQHQIGQDTEIFACFGDSGAGLRVRGLR